MGIWAPRPHQHELADIALPIVREHGLVYLNMEERTGKAITSMVICENSTASKILICSTKKALDGWNETLNNVDHLCSYTLTNYHSAHKVKGEFDAAILDESHNYISGYPKRSGIWSSVRKLVQGLPLIYSSATSHAQGTQLLYHQFALSDWSPWKKFKDFYEWYAYYAIRDKEGRFKTKYIGPNRQAIDYDAVDHERAMNDIRHLFITKTRKELGFEQEPEDVLHFIRLGESTKAAYNRILKDKLLEFTSSSNQLDYTLVCDSPIKLRTSLHMLEGGGFKINEEYVILGNREKIDYILETWGDNNDVVIMYNYTVEKFKLEAVFKHARLLQAASYAEGVDLSKYKHLIIYSQNFSTAKYTQRRARQANMERKDEINVHFLLVERAVSHQVYNTVSINKTNFVDANFERSSL